MFQHLASANFSSSSFNVDAINEALDMLEATGPNLTPGTWDGIRWDTLLINCKIATMDPKMEAEYGAIENGAIAMRGGILRFVGTMEHLDATFARARNFAKEEIDLKGKWVIFGPSLPLVFAQVCV